MNIVTDQTCIILVDDQSSDGAPTVPAQQQETDTPLIVSRLEYT